MTKTFFRKQVGLFLYCIFTSCTHSIHMVQAVSSPPQNNELERKKVVAKTEQKVVIFATDTNFIDEAYEKLKKECLNGDLLSITAQYSTSHGFFSWTNKALFKGYCYSKR